MNSKKQIYFATEHWAGFQNTLVGSLLQVGQDHQRRDPEERCHCHCHRRSSHRQDRNKRSFPVARKLEQRLFRGKNLLSRLARSSVGFKYNSITSTQDNAGTHIQVLRSTPRAHQVPACSWRSDYGTCTSRMTAEMLQCPLGTNKSHRRRNLSALPSYWSKS